MFGLKAVNLYGDDAFQSLLFALNLIKSQTMDLIESGVNVFLAEEGDACDWYGIKDVNRERLENSGSTGEG